jgi:hypothetical protein
MKNIFFITLMISTLFFMQSCSTEEESTATTASQTMTDSTGASVSLDGTYLQACTAGSSEYTKLEVVISGSTYNLKNESFSDDTCATATYTYTSGRTFAVGSATTTSGSDNSSKNDVAVTKIELKLQSIGFTILDDTMVTQWNDASVYGFTDWANGTAKSLLGLNGDGTTDNVSVVDAALYDIWYISGTSFQAGGGDVDQYTVYPTELDYSTILVKQ